MVVMVSFTMFVLSTVMASGIAFTPRPSNEYRRERTTRSSGLLSHYDKIGNTHADPALPFRLPEDCRVDRMSVSDLAYVGDVVFELFVRCRTVWPPRRMSDLQEEVVSIVRAESQSNVLRHIVSDGFPLTAEELRVLQRGRNARIGGGGRKLRQKEAKGTSQKTVQFPQPINNSNTGNTSKTSNSDTTTTLATDKAFSVTTNPITFHQDATAFEALLGYLYITNNTRSSELLQWIDSEVLQKRN